MKITPNLWTAGAGRDDIETFFNRAITFLNAAEGQFGNHNPFKLFLLTLTRMWFVHHSFNLNLNGIMAWKKKAEIFSRSGRFHEGINGKLLFALNELMSTCYYMDKF